MGFLGKLSAHVRWRFTHLRNEWNHRRWMPGHLRGLEESYRNHSARIRDLLATSPGCGVETIYLPEHIGDIVAAEPLVRRIKRTKPSSRIVWIVHPKFAELLVANPDVDLVVPMFCVEEFNRLAADGLLGTIHFCKVEASGCWHCRNKPFIPAQAKSLNGSNYYKDRSLLQAFCLGAGLPDLDEAPVLHLPEEARRSVDSLGLPARFACIHALSNDPARNWTPQGWKRLAEDLIRETGLQVVEVGKDSVLVGTDVPYTDLCGRISLTSSIAVVEKATLFIGIDSGPAHFANAAGISRIALLGRFLGYERYLPYSGGASWLSNLEAIQWPTPPADIPVEEVMRRVDSLLEKGFPRHGASASLSPSVPANQIRP